MLIASPKRASFTILKAEPHLTVLRKENVDPNANWSNTLTELPQRETPSTDMPEPTLNTERKLSEEPKCTYSKTETLELAKTRSRRLSEDPRLKQSRTLAVKPQRAA
jgi:hypothetical protein